jgi:WD40 repeat protein
MVDVVASTKSLIEACIGAYAHFRYLKEECRAVRSSLRNVVIVLDDLHDELLRGEHAEDDGQNTMLAEPMRLLRLATKEAEQVLAKCVSSRILPVAALTRHLLGTLAKVKGDIDEAMRLLQVSGVGLQVSTYREILHVRTTLDEMHCQINDNLASKHEVADLIRTELNSNNGYIVDSLVQQLISKGVVQDKRDCMDQMAELQQEAERLRASKVQYDEELLEAVKTMSLQEPGAIVPLMPSLERGVTVATNVKSRLVCPISLVVMKDPVTLVESGVTYDRRSICRSLLLYPALEPTTGQRYDRPLRYTPNRIVRDMVIMMYGDSYYQKFDDREFLQQYREIWNQRQVSEKGEKRSGSTSTDLILREPSNPSDAPTAVNTQAPEQNESNNAPHEFNSQRAAPVGNAAVGSSCLLSLRTANGVPSSCCIVFDDGRKAIYGSDSNLRVWGLETQSLIYTLNAASPCCCTVFDNDKKAASGMRDGTVVIWDLESRKLLSRYIHPKRSCWGADHRSDEDRVTCCSVFANGTMAMSGSWDRRLKVWDLKRHQKVCSLKGHDDGVNCCSVFANGTRAISGGKDGVLIIWNLSARLLLFKLTGHCDVTCCEVFDDGRKALSGGYDKNLKVWSLVRRKELCTLRGHEGSVRCCALLEGGKRAISGSDDATLKIWDLESQAVLHTLRGHGGPVRWCAVYANGTLAMSGSDDSTIRVWGLPQAAATDA